jgi:hypothetical protein
MVLNLHRQLSLKHEEELPRMNMVMPSLAGAGRHQLFNNVQL